METSSEHATDMEGLPPLPAGWEMVGGIPFNVALHAKIHADFRAGKSYTPLTAESALALLKARREGSVKSSSTPQEQAFMQAWLRRNEERRKAELTQKLSGA